MTNLVQLVKENPGLPILAMVNGEVCWDDGCYWLGHVGSASVEEVGLLGERYYDERDDFKEAYYDKYSEALCAKFNYEPRCCTVSVERGEYTQEQFAANCLAEEKLENYLTEIANKYMIRAIVVYVDPPEDKVIEEATWDEQ
jgi:hypothetical protein